MQGGEQQAGRTTDGEGETFHGISFRRGTKNKKAAGLKSAALAEIGYCFDYSTPAPGQTATRHARRTRRHGAIRANRE